MMHMRLSNFQTPDLISLIPPQGGSHAELSVSEISLGVDSGLRRNERRGGGSHDG